MRKNRKVSEFYSKRFNELGETIESVGWGSPTSQFLRFELLRDNVDLSRKSVLDVGCGFGDLIGYLDGLTAGDYSYYGVDITSEFIKLCKSRFTKPNTHFFEGEVTDFEFPNIDWAFASGVFTLESRNVEKECLKTMRHLFGICSIGFGMNFLSTSAEYRLKKNHHYSSIMLLREALRLTPHVKLLHGTPKHEFSLIIRK